MRNGIVLSIFFLATNALASCPEYPAPVYRCTPYSIEPFNQEVWDHISDYYVQIRRATGMDDIVQYVIRYFNADQGDSGQKSLAAVGRPESFFILPNLLDAAKKEWSHCTNDGRLVHYWRLDYFANDLFNSKDSQVPFAVSTFHPAHPDMEGRFYLGNQNVTNGIVNTSLDLCIPRTEFRP